MLMHLKTLQIIIIANNCTFHHRLEGFKDPWEVSVFKGRQMKPESTLQSHGISSGCTITTVRRVLVPEGLKPIPHPLTWSDCMLSFIRPHSWYILCLIILHRLLMTLYALCESGWKILEEGEDEDDLSSEEEW